MHKALRTKIRIIKDTFRSYVVKTIRFKGGTEVDFCTFQPRTSSLAPSCAVFKNETRWIYPVVRILCFLATPNFNCDFVFQTDRGDN